MTEDEYLKLEILEVRNVTSNMLHNVIGLMNVAGVIHMILSINDNIITSIHYSRFGMLSTQYSMVGTFYHKLFPDNLKMSEFRYTANWLDFVESVEKLK